MDGAENKCIFKEIALDLSNVNIINTSQKKKFTFFYELLLEWQIRLVFWFLFLFLKENLK